MKITKRMPNPDDSIWLGVCRTCLSEAEAKRSELSNVTWDQREGGEHSWEDCPVCGAGSSLVRAGMLFYPKHRTRK